MSSWQVPLMTHHDMESVGTESSPAGITREEGCRLRCGLRHECESKLRDISTKALMLLLPLKIKANSRVYNVLY
ncbi:hypothetical protein TNCV_3969431 [Trichonephila clavipes]|nr:hypothetical protein TNCV_3969431 [Trichonephila clavipes]